MKEIDLTGYKDYWEYVKTINKIRNSRYKDWCHNLKRLPKHLDLNEYEIILRKDIAGLFEVNVHKCEISRISKHNFRVYVELEDDRVALSGGYNASNIKKLYKSAIKHLKTSYILQE